MIFKQLSIVILDGEGHPRSIDAFKYRTRKICHFFNKKIRKIKFRSDLQRVVIYIIAENFEPKPGRNNPGMDGSGVFCFYHHSLNQELKIVYSYNN